MAIRRVFIDWTQPFLPTVARHLLDEREATRASEGFLDLSNLLIVFPTRQGSRRFLQLLTEAAGGQLAPPECLTVGNLPEQLYTPQFPFAPALTQALVWSEALRTLPSEEMQVVVRQPPAEGDTLGWLQLGDLLRRQHAELAGDRLDFADVARLGPSLDGFDEEHRWSVLAKVQREYLNRLDAEGLWDQQTARLVAIEKEECQLERELICVGTVDLNRTLRGMLDQVADRTTVYLHAPEELADSFDRHGCLIPAAWLEREVPIGPEQVHVVNDPASQADQVVADLASLEGAYSAEQITIAMPDRPLVPRIQRRLEHFGVSTYWPIRCQLSATAPFRFLLAAADYLETRRSDDFAALIRHPDVSRWLTKQGLDQDWLSDWDNSFCLHLMSRTSVSENWPKCEVTRKLIRQVDGLLNPLRVGKRKLSQFGELVEQILFELYQHQTLDSSDPDQSAKVEACQAIQDAFTAHESLPAGLDPTLSAGDAIRLTLDSISREELYRVEEGGQIELSGWLDLALDDSPVLIITSFNDGMVPSSVNHDLFLPNRLRVHLGLEDNSRRYARDCHLVSAALHSRDVVRFIVGRRNDLGDPLVPSRLLFAAEPEEIARRVVQFYDRSEQPDRQRVASPFTPAKASRFPIPEPVPLSPPRTRFRVTEFRDYLASPYRYYLRNQLGLTEAGDSIEELDPLAFGSLLHQIMQRFGKDEIRDSRDPAEIASALNTYLDEEASRLYREDSLVAVKVQIEQTRARLRGFARWQADWRNQGWQIHSVERKQRPVPFQLDDGREIELVGRIDRIDFHPGRGEWIIFDYKTGDQGKHPDKTHRTSDGEWCDLQLPLYRHLARPLGVTESAQLAYLLLPKDSEKVREEIATWTDVELEEADAVARSVAAEILDGRFWVELDDHPGTMNEFDGICQSGVIGQKVIR